MACQFCVVGYGGFCYNIVMALNLENLNPEQRKAVTHQEGPLLIVAGAGTGKTTVITQRIAWLIEQKMAKSNEILSLTFTDKAAGEMEERIDRLLPYGYLDLWVSTFHSFAERILKENALEIGLPNNFKVLDQTEQWLLVRENLDRFELDYYKPLGNPTKFIHSLIKFFSRAKDDDVSPADYLKYAEDLKLNTDSAELIKDFVEPEILKSLTKKERKEFIAQEIKKTQEVADAYHTYQQLLLENQAFDFGDLITYCLKLFKDRPAVLAKYRRQFKHVLVDEFQDTNYAQYELIKLLAAPQNNITVVGDDDQSIYKFRGASVSNILEFKKDYPAAKEVFLIKNYRSTQNILDLSYQFIQQNNPDRLEVKLAKNSAKKLSKELKSQNDQKGVIEHLHYRTGEEEVAGVVKRIAELKELDKEADWNDFAILARTNEVANSFALGLGQTNIPYRFLASRGLYTKPIILDVLAYFRLLDDYHESQAVYRILNSSVMGFSHQELVQLNYWAKRKGYSLFSILSQPEVRQKSSSEIREKIDKFLGLVNRHSQLAKSRPASEVFLAFLKDTGYLDLITRSETTEMLHATNYLNQFYKKINEFEKSFAEKSVKHFLQMIDLELEAGETGSLTQDLEDGPDAVKVITVHAAKGLEFKYVFIVNLVDRRFPIDDRSDPITLPDSLIKEILPEGDAHLQEERRLFYVAMTRAKKGLFLTSAVDYGGQRKKRPSIFLHELGSVGLKLVAAKADSGSQIEARLKTQPRLETKISAEDLDYLLPHKFSFSQIKSFKNCPYHYWLEYILKIPQAGKDIFSFGSTLHLTLQHFFQLVMQRSAVSQPDLFSVGKKILTAQKSVVSFDELLAIYDKDWIDDWYASRPRHDQFKAAGKKALKLFYQRYQKELPLPKYLEQMFSLPLTDSGESYVITGKIDRIDSLNGGVVIIDYKTGQGKTQSTIYPDDKQQLLIYQLAAQEVFGEKVEQLMYYYLETDTRVPFLGQAKDLVGLKASIIKTIQEIRSTPFPIDASACRCQNNRF
ncbi:MAG: hypothetical protein A3A24_01845 [Candidatus Buchananbacteria bacterium RIFCSPLOWO2_01_FULL_46_12]|uniref:DNA 3'-5' helicase n=2 Tax=Candidatus Buchananiibacteriota TaxID=1817903 RepID=A0A1G1YMS5_9BACT|nr:MAG: hypothetical protein A2744_00445 [Candidatus Buchananbacteria bacterium RIFCSPHIGHO2_01_FULL_44_11]OGY53662.1 MAG: hypothetical protein A3A24_01845 [Candidatus Buchananbacteria bacterium RIFCSPLOWO2_01_FULL_46_12]